MFSKCFYRKAYYFVDVTKWLQESQVNLSKQKKKRKEKYELQLTEKYGLQFLVVCLKLVNGKDQPGTFISPRYKSNSKYSKYFSPQAKYVLQMASLWLIIFEFPMS